MTTVRSKRATGYPPVTPTEEQSGPEPRLGAGPLRPVGLDADGKLIVDAMAAVFDDHRGRIGRMALSLEGKRAVRDLLDEVFLDLLQVVLNEASAVEQVLQRRPAPP